MMSYISDGDLLHTPAAERARRKALLFPGLLAVAFLVGAPGAYLVANTLEASYTAEGSLWIEGSYRQGSNDAAARQDGGQLESKAWIELLRSHRVLEPVVVDQQLFLRPPGEYAQAFASFTVAKQFIAGTYELRVGDLGEKFELVNDQGAVVQRGTLGSPVGQSLGFIWTPSRASFPPKANVEFAVLSLGGAIEYLSKSLSVAMDRRGGFLRLRLIGPDPTEVADVLNAVMDGYVQLAGELKKGKVKELQATLESQLQTIELELKQAERDLEEFKIGENRESLDRSLPPAERMAEEERLSRRVQVAESLYSQLRGRLEAARLSGASSTPDIRILDRARTPARPDKDIRVPMGMAIFLGCLAAALGSALFLSRLAAIKAAAF